MQFMTFLLLGSLHFYIVDGVRPTREIPFDDYFIRYSVKHKIAPELPMAVAWVESRYWPHSKSSAGAIGVMQVLYTTGRDMLPNLVLLPSDLKKPEVGIEAGIKYLKHMANKYKDTRGRTIWRQVLAAYCSGPGNVDKLILRNGRFSKQVSGYISRVSDELYFGYGLRLADIR